MTLIIGLTGGIGSGKSTVSAFFAELNVTIVDADIVAREVVMKGQPALDKIALHFGDNILIDGELNRSLLREKIFQDNNQLKWLNALLHPLINNRIVKQLEGAKGNYAILEAPLLFENRLDILASYNLIIDVEHDIQIKRASLRDGVSLDSIKTIIDKQISRAARLEKANFIIENNRVSLAYLKKQVADLDKKFNELALKNKNAAL